MNASPTPEMPCADDFRRLGVRAEEWRPAVIRRAASRSSKTLAARLLNASHEPTAVQLCRVSLSAYHLLDPRRRESSHIRAHIGRILPQVSAATSAEILAAGQRPRIRGGVLPGGGPSESDNARKRRVEPFSDATISQSVADEAHENFVAMNQIVLEERQARWNRSLDHDDLLRGGHWVRRGRRLLSRLAVPAMLLTSCVLFGWMGGLWFLQRGDQERAESLIQAAIAKKPQAAAVRPEASSVSAREQSTQAEVTAGEAGPPGDTQPNSENGENGENELPRGNELPGDTKAASETSETLETDGAPETLVQMLEIKADVIPIVSETTGVDTMSEPAINPDGSDNTDASEAFAKPDATDLSAAAASPSDAFVSGATSTETAADSESGFLSDPFSAAVSDVNRDLARLQRSEKQTLIRNLAGSVHDVEAARRLIERLADLTGHDDPAVRRDAMRETIIAAWWVEPGDQVRKRLRFYSETFGMDFVETLDETFQIAITRDHDDAIDVQLARLGPGVIERLNQGGRHKSAAKIAADLRRRSKGPQDATAFEQLNLQAERYASTQAELVRRFGSDRPLSDEPTQAGAAKLARYWALVRREWALALPLFPALSDAKLKEAARLELAWRSGQVELDREALAKLWSEAVASLTEAHQQRSIILHAEAIRGGAPVTRKPSS